MVTGLLRLKLLLAEHGRRLAVLSAVFGLVLLAWSGVAYSQPQTRTVTDQTHVQTISTTVNERATVTGNSTLWEQGQQLENRPFYPASAPVLTLRVATTAPDGQTVQLSHTLTLVYQVVRDETAIWERERVLLSDRGPGSDGSLFSTTTVDTRAVRAELKTINDEMTGIGSARVQLLVNTTYDTGRYSGSLSERAPFHVVQNGYWIAEDLHLQKTHSTPVTNRVTTQPDLMSYLLPGLAGSVASALAIGLWIYRGRGPGPERIRDRLERARYAEWISAGYLDGNLADRQVQVRSLADLVDIGIDSDKRAIHDADRGLYGVIDGDVLYYYPTAESALGPTVPTDEWEWPFEDPGAVSPSEDDGNGGWSPELEGR